MEPRPWPEDGATEIEKTLLRAGRTEAPRKGADVRILAMIQGASQGSLQGPAQGSAASTFKPVVFTRWAKVGLIALVAGGAAVVGYQRLRPHTVSPPDLPAVTDRAVAPATTPGVAAVAQGRLPDRAAGSHEASVGPEAVRDEAPPSVPGDGSARGRRAIAMGRSREPSQRSSDLPSDLPSLGDETKALDRAREALDARRPSEVMRLLDGYHRRFPQGRLKPEAMILRLAALVQAGGHEAAESLARQLLSDEAYTSYAPRIQSLLREAKP